VGECRAVSVFPPGERREKGLDLLPEVDREAEDRPQLNNDGIHLPVAAGEIDVRERLGNPQMGGGTDRKKLGQAFDNAQQFRKQKIVHDPSICYRPFSSESSCYSDLKAARAVYPCNR
jgi:hypothetical protein